MRTFYLVYFLCTFDLPFSFFDFCSGYVNISQFRYYSSCSESSKWRVLVSFGIGCSCKYMSMCTCHLHSCDNFLCTFKGCYDWTSNQRRRLSWASCKGQNYSFWQNWDTNQGRVYCDWFSVYKWWNQPQHIALLVAFMTNKLSCFFGEIYIDWVKSLLRCIKKY